MHYTSFMANSDRL